MPDPPPDASCTPRRRDEWDAFAYGWRVGMYAWAALFVVGIASDEDPEWMLGLVGPFVFGAFQFVAMLPGALVFLVWYRLARGAALRPVLATLQGCMVGLAALTCWTVFLEIPFGPGGLSMWVWLDPTYPSMAVLVGAATFSAGARQLQRERDSAVDAEDSGAESAQPPPT